MPNLSDEELAQKISEAVEKEHYAIAGDQFYRESLAVVAQKVNAGLLDTYVFTVGKEQFEQFKNNHPINAAKPKKEKPTTTEKEKKS